MTRAKTAPQLVRPASMRVEAARCLHCALCTSLAPELSTQPQHIRVNRRTLEAMAACPVGAIVWHEPSTVQPEAAAQPR